MARTTVRRGMPDVTLTKAEFVRRFHERFYDPIFDTLAIEVNTLADAAWDAYDSARNSPRTGPASDGFADPTYELSIEWLKARDEVREAERTQKDPNSPSRILLINGSSRSDQTCPGEMSKTFRLVGLAQAVFQQAGLEIDLLDLSRVTSEYGRTIHPCKSCVSTAMPLCHWPCSCYPNHSLGQVNDWMAEIYPKWSAAHGVMIVTPVNWYQAPGPLKQMMDRLVCADGGNPDPTSTSGKDAEKAKDLEMKGWPYPRHLAGRLFSVVAHGDTAGAETLRRILTDWLSDIGLISAGHKAEMGAYVGYYRPYASSHDDLDRDTDFQEEVRNAARTLIEGVKLLRSGKLPQPGAGLREPRPK
jgi:multimeric flavodoxin WrbA